MSIALWGGFLVGLMFSYLGYIRSWSFIKTVVLAELFGLLILLAKAAFALEAVPSNLKDTTVHISDGSGFTYKGRKGDEYLITNWHVCNAANWHGVMTGNFESGEILRGPIIKADGLADLCASKIKPGHKTLKMAKTLVHGQSIFTRGYPYHILSESSGKYIGVEKWVFTYPIEEVGVCFSGSYPAFNGNGVVVGCTAPYVDNLTTLYSRPGSSGSPVVDSNGDLVGVMSSWMSDRDAGGMVKFEVVKEFLEGL